jgi:hypothetical protein
MSSDRVSARRGTAGVMKIILLFGVTLVIVAALVFLKAMGLDRHLSWGGHQRIF